MLYYTILPSLLVYGVVQKPVLKQFIPDISKNSNNAYGIYCLLLSTSPQLLNL